MKKSKKVVLLFPSLRDGSNKTSFMVGRLPHSLLYLARNLPECDVEIYDERDLEWDWEKIKRSMDEALCVGISVFTGYQVHSGLRMTRKIRETHPDVPVVWGGWHPSLEPRQTLDEPTIDYLVLGQGEATFKDLVGWLENKTGDLAAINGIAYRENGEVRITRPRKIENSEVFPPINYDLVDCNKYVYKTFYSERSIAIFASHGCPYSCGFCSVYKVFERRWFRKDVDNIIAEMKYLKKKCGIDSLTFDDDNFFVNLQFSQELFKAMIKEKINLKWASNAHSTSFLKMCKRAPGFMDLMREAGCSQILIGAETGNNDILERVIGKQATVADTYLFVYELKKRGIIPQLSTMCGFPVGEGKDYLDTIDMLVRCKNVDESVLGMLFFYTPYPGTPLYGEAVRNGFNPPKTLDGWGRHSLTEFKNPWISDEGKRFVRNFMCFYWYYYHRAAVTWHPNPVRIFLKSIIYLICKVRFKLKFFKLQWDAEIFRWLLMLLDRLKIVSFDDRPWAEYEPEEDPMNQRLVAQIVDPPKGKPASERGVKPAV